MLDEHTNAAELTASRGGASPSLERRSGSSAARGRPARAALVVFELARLVGLVVPAARIELSHCVRSIVEHWRCAINMISPLRTI